MPQKRHYSLILESTAQSGESMAQSRVCLCQMGVHSGYDNLRAIDNNVKYQSKMRANDNFNIITGESKPQFHYNTHNRRFASLETIRILKQAKAQEVQQGVFPYNSRKLGTAQDSHLYQYSYIPKHSAFNESKITEAAGLDARKKHSEPLSLINASKAQHNLINHSANIDSAGQDWGITKKKSPVSKFTDLGRIYAPNYSDSYKEEGKFGKKTALCNTICEIQRSYGTDKFFRKFK